MMYYTVFVKSDTYKAKGTPFTARFYIVIGTIMLIGAIIAALVSNP